MKFRPLKADEIECRVSTVKTSGISLLLYKDARVDMRLLDETVGTMNWKRSHQIVDGNLYCTIEVWDAEKEQWIAKQDVGTESYTEKEKGQASDSFKRAGFNWGIGRELYTAPFIWIPSSKCNIKERNGRETCDDRFSVKSINIVGGVITALEIVNEKTNALVFSYGKVESTPEKETLEESKKTINKTKQKALADRLAKLGVNSRDLLAQYGANDISELSENDHFDIIRKLNEAEERIRKAESKLENKDIADLVDKVNKSDVDIDKLMALYKVETFKELTYKQRDNMLKNWDKILEKCK